MCSSFCLFLLFRLKHLLFSPSFFLCNLPSFIILRTLFLWQYSAPFSTSLVSSSPDVRRLGLSLEFVCVKQCWVSPWPLGRVGGKTGKWNMAYELLPTCGKELGFHKQIIVRLIGNLFKIVFKTKWSPKGFLSLTMEGLRVGQLHSLMYK